MAKSVLIVDGDQGFAQSAQDALEILGVQVHVVDDATIDLIRKFRPSVLLMNVELGRKQVAGFSLCSRIRNDKDLKSLPIFLTSNEATPQSLEKHAQTPYRADEYAIKPIAIEDLVARLQKMLESAPDAAPSDNGIGEAFDANFEESARTPDLPPPLPRNATQGPPPLPTQGPPRLPTAPPPLQKTQDAAPPGPPALPKETPSEGDLWPRERFEEAFRQAVAAEPEQPLGRASPEERLNALRNLIKKYQAREKTLKATWEEVMQRGSELARTIAAAEFAQHQESQRLEEVIRNRDQLQQRLKSVEAEFRAFQDEITRIFQEKDAEEAVKAEERQRLEEEVVSLREQIQQAHEALSDDQRRFKLLQEEIEHIDQLRAENEAAAKEIADLKARLEMVEAVSADRGTEVHNLQDQLDQLRFEHGQTEQRLKKEHQAELERKEAEHQEKIFSLEATHLAQIEALEERHRELLETLNSTHEAEAAEYEERRLQASNQILALNEKVAELEGQLEAALAKDERIRELQAQMQELEENLEAERSEAGRRINELEEELDRVQTELFEGIATLDHYKKTTANLEARTQDLDTALRTAEKSLKQYKAEAAQLKKVQAERDELAEQVSGLEEQLSRLEEKDRETTRMLEEERAKAQRAEEFVRKAKEKLESAAEERQRYEEEFEERLEQEMAARQELEALLESERKARAEEAAQSEELQSELSRREAELSDAYSHATSLERKLEALTAENTAKDAELEGLKRSIEDAGAQIGSLTADNDALQFELADTQQKLESIENEVNALRASEAALIKEIEEKANRVQQLESLTGDLKKDLERALSDVRAMHERQRLLRKAAGVLEQAKKSIPEYFTAEVIAEAAAQEALKPPQIYTGEVEPLDMTVDPDYQPPTAVIRQAALASNLSESDNAAPFAALMAEIQAAEAEDPLGFDEHFAGEPTTENPRVPSQITRAAKQQPAAKPRNRPRVGGALSTPISRRAQDKDDEEEEGSVTEIIRLDKLE